MYINPNGPKTNTKNEQKNELEHKKNTSHSLWIGDSDKLISCEPLPMNPHSFTQRSTYIHATWKYFQGTCNLNIFRQNYTDKKLLSIQKKRRIAKNQLKSFEDYGLVKNTKINFDTWNMKVCKTKTVYSCQTYINSYIFAFPDNVNL